MVTSDPADPNLCPHCGSSRRHGEERDAGVGPDGELPPRKSFGSWVVCDECGNEWPDPALSQPLPREPSSASVPTPEATWGEIWHFAHLVDGYRTHGDALGNMANASVSHFEREHEIDPLLPLADLRACLFFEARRYRHFGHDPDSDDTPYLRALVTAIRDMAADGSRPG